jgi:hypothetical protein
MDFGGEGAAPSSDVLGALDSMGAIRKDTVPEPSYCTAYDLE